MKDREKRLFKWLFNTNLIYAYPMSNNKAKKKLEKNKKIDFQKSIRNMYLMGMISILVLYSAFLWVVDFSKTPIMLDSFVAVFIIMVVTQNFVYFFNVFYESKDVEHLQVLPVKEKTVFLSKLATVAFTSVQLASPILVIFSFFLYRMGKDIPFVIFFSIIDFLLIFVIMLTLNMFIMLILGKLNVLQKIKSIATTIVSIIAMLVNMFLIVAIQIEAKNAFISSFFTGYRPTFFFSKYATSVEGQGLIIGSLLVVGGGLGYFCYRTLSQGFYNTILSMREAESLSKKEKTMENKQGSPKTILWKLNFSHLKDPTLLPQLLISELIVIFMVMIMFFVNPEIIYFLKGYSNIVLPLLTLLTILMGNTGNNLSAYVVSLDGESFNFIKALPIKRKDYILNKIIFSCLVQYFFIVPFIIGLGIYLETDLLYILVSLIILIFLGIPMTVLWLVYDFNHLLLDWNNMTDLMTKVGKVIPIVLTIFLLFVMGLLFGLTPLIAEFEGAIYSVYLIICIISIALVILSIAKVKELIRNNR